MNEEQTYLCTECGAAVTEEYLHEFDERILCSSCLDNLTTICNCCGERIWRSDDEGDGSISLCSGCREYNYVTCEGCGCLIPNDEANYDDDYPYCNECYRKLQECAIKSYNYKPEPIFYGSGNLFYGVELEIDKGGERSDYAEAILNTANMHNEYLYAKHDGSLNDGNILKIKPTGKLVRGKFNFNNYSHLKYCNWWDYGVSDTSEKSAYTDIYIEDLKAVAAYQGYSPEDIDDMLSSGISPYEIEEYLYNAE